MYRVEWDEAALDELAAVWNEASSVVRKDITAASHLLEQQLSTDPYADSESRPGGRRITFAPPLAATFRVETDEHTVTVLYVRMYQRRKS